ncbi:unnamed protein product, partial [Prorocentrum cordatum]
LVGGPGRPGRWPRGRRQPPRGAGLGRLGRLVLRREDRPAAARGCRARGPARRGRRDGPGVRVLRRRREPSEAPQGAPQAALPWRLGADDSRWRGGDAGPQQARGRPPRAGVPVPGLGSGAGLCVQRSDERGHRGAAGGGSRHRPGHGRLRPGWGCWRRRAARDRLGPRLARVLARAGIPPHRLPGAADQSRRWGQCVAQQGGGVGLGRGRPAGRRGSRGPGGACGGDREDERGRLWRLAPLGVEGLARAAGRRPCHRADPHFLLWVLGLGVTGVAVRRGGPGGAARVEPAAPRRDLRPRGPVEPGVSGAPGPPGAADPAGSEEVPAPPELRGPRPGAELPLGRDQRRRDVEVRRVRGQGAEGAGHRTGAGFGVPGGAGVGGEEVREAGRRQGKGPQGGHKGQGESEARGRREGSGL